MCGIAGIVRPDATRSVEEQALLRMAGAIRHRGPDGFGLALDAGAGLVATRLAIFDIPRGWQPLESGPGGSVLVYNGEVYNHPELRAELSASEESFETTCDTEVVLRLLERHGLAALERLNGQFALAWWQPEQRRLTLVRDRFGVRPLHYALSDDGSLVFGSEAKALFASGEVSAAPDPAGIDEVFTLWGPRSPRTAFRGVNQVRAGGLIVWERGRIVADRTWWSPSYGEDPSDPTDLDELLRESVRLRLRADVPVGTYLSGGLDSSLITALAQAETDHQLRTFSIAFADPRYDERSHQQEVARAIGTRHHVVEAGPAEIATTFPEVVWHAEMPLVRTAPVPLFLLAREVREREITVVATGEGADELFWGYELFKEVVLRELHAREPERAIELLEQMYSYLGPAAARRGPAWRRFLLETGADDEELGSHLTRAEATSTVKAFYRPDVAAEVGSAPRSIASAPTSRPPSPAGARSSAPPGSSSPRCSTRTCSRPRETESRWRTASKAAIRSSTIGCSPTLRACPRRGSSTACERRSRCASSRPRSCLPRSPNAANSPIAPRRSPRSSRRDRPPGCPRRSRPRPWPRRRSGTRDAWRGWCGAVAAAARRGCASRWR